MGVGSSYPKELSVERRSPLSPRDVKSRPGVSMGRTLPCRGHRGDPHFVAFTPLGGRGFGDAHQMSGPRSGEYAKAVDAEGQGDES